MEIPSADAYCQPVYDRPIADSRNRLARPFYLLHGQPARDRPMVLIKKLALRESRRFGSVALFRAYWNRVGSAVSLRVPPEV